MPEVPDTSAEPTVEAAKPTVEAAEPSAEAADHAAPDATADGGGAPEDLKSSFRDALARKAGKNSHVESHLDGRHLGSGNNDTHKRQFRRKSG